MKKSEKLEKFIKHELMLLRRNNQIRKRVSKKKKKYYLLDKLIKIKQYKNKNKKIYSKKSQFKELFLINLSIRDKFEKGVVNIFKEECVKNVFKNIYKEYSKY